eukprot:gene11810-8121_t
MEKGNRNFKFKIGKINPSLSIFMFSNIYVHKQREKTKRERDAVACLRSDHHKRGGGSKATTKNRQNGVTLLTRQSISMDGDWQRNQTKKELCASSTSFTHITLLNSSQFFFSLYIYILVQFDYRFISSLSFMFSLASAYLVPNRMSFLFVGVPGLCRTYVSSAYSMIKGKKMGMIDENNPEKRNNNNNNNNKREREREQEKTNYSPTR